MTYKNDSVKLTKGAGRKRGLRVVSIAQALMQFPISLWRFRSVSMALWIFDYDRVGKAL